jgi:hypothetical protein
MSTPSSFYVEQAEVCAKAALDALLPNQREKYLRSQAAWQALADRDQRIKEAREVREAERAEDRTHN